MLVREPWFENESDDERQARREAYERIAGAAGRMRVPLERLDALLHQLYHNEAETRRFLADLYNVPDDSLDDFLRLRLKDLAEDETDTPDTSP
ncbi:MAG TPA: hypothetical protein VFJ16_03675 [Longimicrobium sp.]|nr:hypothetical protein [Longimicrobium sp.]